MNFIEQYKMSPDICDNLVSYFKNNTEYKKAGLVGGGDLKLEIKKSTDVCFYNGSNDKRIKQFFKALSGCVQSYCKKHNVCHYVKTDDLGNNIHYYKPGEGFFKNHYERDAIISARRELVYMVYLNTLTDKGGTIFPVQKKNNNTC